MRLKIELVSDSNVVLHVGFNSNIQALIYNLLDRVDGNWLHEEGYKFEKRSFKLFDFYYILESGRHMRNEKLFIFPHQISFYISFPLEWVSEQFAKNAIISDKIRSGSDLLSVHSINVIKPSSFDKNTMKVRAITPTEVHFTFIKPDDKKLTYHYNPFENGFSKLVNNNLRKKWESFYNKEAPDDILIKPLFPGNRNEKIRYFLNKNRQTVAKGWEGRYKLSGDRKLMEFALDTGLGNRNR